MLKSDIMRKVLIRMDEISPFNVGLITSTVNPIYGYIEDCMPAAWQSLINRLPSDCIPVIIKNTGASIHDDLSISFTCNFFRVVCFKMKSWKKEVADIINTDSPLWKEQHNKFTRGSVFKPVVVKLSDNEIKAFSAKDISDSLDYCKGVAPLMISDDIDIPANLQDSYLFEIAGHVYTVMEQFKLAEAMFMMAEKQFKK